MKKMTIIDNLPDTNETALLTHETKAQLLGISYRTLTRWIREGKVKFVILGKTGRKYFLPERENIQKWERKKWL